jgi:hypothetical protein
MKNMTKLNDLSLLKTLISTGTSVTTRAKFLINIQFAVELEVGKTKYAFFPLPMTRLVAVNQNQPEAQDTSCSGLLVVSQLRKTRLPNLSVQSAKSADLTKLYVPSKTKLPNQGVWDEKYFEKRSCTFEFISRMFCCIPEIYITFLETIL